jgi:integrase/recombinase XerD
MLLSQVIKGYNLTSVANGMSIQTVERYRYNFDRLIEFLGDVEFESITEKQLHDFFYYLRTDYVPRRPNGDPKKLSEATIHTFWKAIRSLYNFASTELETQRPDLSLPFPNHSNENIVPFTMDEVRSMVKACRNTMLARTKKRRSWSRERPTWRRDEAIILTLVDTGIRASELCRLEIGHVNLENEEITIIPWGSGRKTAGRTVYIGRASKRSLWHYLMTRDNPRDNEPFFITQELKSFDRQVLLNLIARIGEHAGIANAHPHRFRHTFAIEYLRNGGDIYTLQKLLGHRSLRMCLRYLDIVNSDIATAHRRASPADKWRL